ncbi:hypothetical protein HanXRQr2_Chr17g0809501 [Helianthus annuus]|uniref:Uncharacterized protein n=1 Tax=Helianthus annuus TaxID=4232 RepID=A0A9K3DJV6_HELAN|nr:hypothetical protein HanXRQr2_Chr17g0809501 [Helianthus annuus]KAJ0813878.1 hypothetical protein HanPSC8_Chr17g0778771 [Helianthus annuus]
MAQPTKDVPRNMMHESKDVETYLSIRKVILRIEGLETYPSRSKHILRYVSAQLL